MHAELYRSTVLVTAVQVSNEELDYIPLGNPVCHFVRGSGKKRVPFYCSRVRCCVRLGGGATHVVRLKQPFKPFN